MMPRATNGSATGSATESATESATGSAGKPGRGPTKGRIGRRSRLQGGRGRGTLETEKPPLLGLIQRQGQVGLQMLPHVQQETIPPIVEAAVAKSTLLDTDEYACDGRLTTWGDHHKTVC